MKKNRLTRVENDAGDVFHYANGRLHYHAGPAVTYMNGNYEYYVDGYLHRLNGPAYKNNSGTKWFIMGRPAPKGYAEFIENNGMLDQPLNNDDILFIRLMWPKFDDKVFVPPTEYELETNES